jgi:GGDEF domain-containing protein
VLAVIGGTSIMVNTLANRLRTLVLHDPLTSVLNRRGLEFHAPQIASIAARLEMSG